MDLFEYVYNQYKVSNPKPSYKIGERTLRDEIVKYLINERVIFDANYVKHWNWNKIKDLYLKHVRKGEENA